VLKREWKWKGVALLAGWLVVLIEFCQNGGRGGGRLFWAKKGGSRGANWPVTGNGPFFANWNRRGAASPSPSGHKKLPIASSRQSAGKLLMGGGMADANS
jgi:hypothetical protein